MDCRGFELQTSGVARDCSTNCAVPPPLPVIIKQFNLAYHMNRLELLTKEKWGTAASTFVYFTQLLPSGGDFLAEMAGQQTGLNGRETKLARMAGQKIVQKRPVGGTKCVK